MAFRRTSAALAQKDWISAAIRWSGLSRNLGFSKGGRRGEGERGDGRGGNRGGREEEVCPLASPCPPCPPVSLLASLQDA